MDIKERLMWINLNSWYGINPGRHNMDVVNDILNKIVRQQREHTERTLAEVIEKYDFMVGSTELMNELEPILPEGAHITYTPYLGDPDAIYVIKRFNIRDLLNEALKEQNAAEKEESK